MPVYNERETVLAIIGKVLRLEIVCELVVVDDGSTDGTAELLRATAFDGRVRLFFHDRNRGKGAAIRTAIAAVTGDAVIIQDADLEYDPQDYVRLLEPMDRLASTNSCCLRLNTWPRTTRAISTQ